MARKRLYKEASVHNIQESFTPSVELEKLLVEFSYLFNEPTELPPARGYDHCITLHLGSAPIVVRLYRYPNQQKDEIE